MTTAPYYLRALTARALQTEVLRKGNIYLLTSVLSQGVIFLAWMILPWKLSTVEIGQFALVSFGTDLLMRFILMGTDSAIVRFYVDEHRRAESFRTARIWVLIGVGLAATILWLTQSLVPRLILGLAGIYGHVMWLMLATSTSTASATLIFSHHIAIGNAAQFGRLNMLRSALTGGGFVTAAWLGFGVPGLLVAQMVGALAVVVIFMTGRETPMGQCRVSRQSLVEMAGYGLPMTAYAAMGLLSDYTGRLLLGSGPSLAELGVYQFYFQIAVQVNGLWATLNRAWTPYIFRIMSQNRRRAFETIRRAVIMLSSLYALALILCMLVGQTGLWSLIVAPAYAARINLFYLLLLGPLFGSLYTAITPPFYFGRNTVRISATQSAIAVLTMLLSVHMTIRYGANGAAAGWVAGIFLASVFYMLAFPGYFADLRTVGQILAIWAIGATVVAGVLVRLQTPWLAMAALVACIVGVALVGWRDWSTPAVTEG